MKNIFLKSILLLIVTSAVISCGERDDIIYDPNSAQAFVFFSEDGSDIRFDDTMPETGFVDIEVGVSNLSTSDRTVQLEVVAEETDATADQYVLESSLIVPANAYFGTFRVSGVYENLTTARVNLVILISSIDEDNPSNSEVTHTVALRRD